MTSLLGRLLHFITERGAKNLTLDDLIGRLEKNTPTIQRWFETVPDIPKNHDLAKHVIGIERWGQRRLRVALGEPFMQEEYDRYRPAAHDMPTLSQEFADTRAETLRIARQLCEQHISPVQQVAHNDMGGVTVRGWLHYLDGHAYRESSRFKRK